MTKSILRIAIILAVLFAVCFSVYHIIDHSRYKVVVTDVDGVSFEQQQYVVEENLSDTITIAKAANPAGARAMRVCILVSNGELYYDGQPLTPPEGWEYRRIGVCKLRNSLDETLPLVTLKEKDATR